MRTAIRMASGRWHVVDLGEGMLGIVGLHATPKVWTLMPRRLAASSAAR